MIDYLLRFASETQAMDALPVFAPDFSPEPRSWDTSCCLPNVRCFRDLGTETIADPDMGEITMPLREYLPGWYVIVALDTRDDGAFPADAVVLIADRDAGTILHTITTQADLATLRLEPVFAGSDYPFGAPVVEG